jgi:hypothetical protein
METTEECLEECLETPKVKKPRKPRTPKVKFQPDPEEEEEQPQVVSFEPEVSFIPDDDFLSELNNEHFIQTEPEPERVYPKKPRAPRKTKVAVEESVESIEMYSEQPTQIQGRDKLILHQKVKQYMLLFPAELKSFKIAKNQTVENLELILLEMETIIEIGNTDAFVTDCIIQCIRMVEPISAKTENYNISGLSLVLKNSSQFNSLLKQLYLKYNTYSQIPIEVQCGMIVITSAVLMTQKNKNKKHMEEYLNESIQVGGV